MGKPLKPSFLRVPDSNELQHSAAVIHLLAEPTRLGILSILLAGNESSVNDMAKHLGRPVAATSQHLAKLKSGGLVLSRREGTTMFYQLAGEHVAALVENLLQHTEHQLFTDPPHHRRLETTAEGESLAVAPVKAFFSDSRSHG